MSPRKGGAGALLLLVSLSCAPIAIPSPTASPVPVRRVLDDATAILTRVSAYDFALAGWFAGERVRVVSPERYAAALAAERQKIATVKDGAISVAFAEGTKAAALVSLADALSGVAEHLSRFSGLLDGASFAEVVDDVDRAWRALDRAAADAATRDAMTHAMAWTITIQRASAVAVVTAPYPSRSEMEAAARTLGQVEQLAPSAPFTIRVATFDDRVTADARVAQLRAVGVVAAAVETQRYGFSREGPLPDAELRREPALDVPVSSGARRAAFVAGGFVVAAIDGTTYGFDGAGRARWYQKLASGPSLVTPSADGRLVLVGGVVVNLFTSDGVALGTSQRLPSAAVGAVWVDRRATFVAASQGPTGQPGGGGGLMVAFGADGKPLGAPFPLITPAAGPAVATSPARDEVWIATTSSGTTDVETVRPGLDAKIALVARVAGQVVDLAVDADATYAALVTAQGTYRFRPTAADVAASIERVTGVARAVRFASDGTLYVLQADRLTAFDRALRSLWTVPLQDGRRVVVAKDVIVQDGLARLLVVDPRTGAVDELGTDGDIADLATSADGARVLALVDGPRAVVFVLP